MTVSDAIEEEEPLDSTRVEHTKDKFEYSKPIKTSAVRLYKKRLVEDKLFRKKFIIFICLCYSFLILGLNIGQFGPTLLDLQKITGCSLDQAAFFFNAHTLGYLTSSILTGIVFERFNKLLQMFLPCFLLTGVNAAIPWCSIYEVMVTVHFFKGFFLGFLDAVANALLLHLLAQEVKTYMQILHFMFAFGGIISPIISAPFLSKPDLLNLTIQNVYNSSIWNATVGLETNMETAITNYTDVNHLETANNLSKNYHNPTNFSSVIVEESEVYKAYTITAVMSFSSAIPFLLIYIFANESSCPTAQNNTEEHTKEHIPIRLKLAVLSILSLIIMAYTAMEDTYAGFLTTFTVKHQKWTKAQGSFATSVFWTSFAVGRFSGIFIVNLFKQSRLLLVYSIMIISAFVCLLGTSFHYIGEGIWIASVIAGFAMSIFFPIFFSWTEEKFFHVDGKVTALIMATAMLGVIINPIILARVMESRPIWFSYLLLVESVLLFLFYCVGIYIARLIRLQRLKHKKNINIVIDDTDAQTVDPLVCNSKL